MNKLKNVAFTASLLALLTTLLSCSKNTIDGIYRATSKWTTDYTGDPGNITVPAGGGIYKLVCANYRTLRFANRTADDSSIIHEGEVISTGIMGRWYTAELTGNTLMITIKPNTIDKIRRLISGIRAGDIVNRVKIAQEK